MPKTKEQKHTIVADLEKKLADNKTFFVLATDQVNPNEAASLKIKLSEVGGEYHVVKNSLFKIAIEKAGLEKLESLETGQNAVVFVGDQSPEAAKIVKTFIETLEAPKDVTKLDFKEGYLEGKKMSGEEVKQLAELPSRDQLIAQVLATMNAPLSGFVNVLAGNVRSIINVIDAYKNTKN